MNRLSFFKAIAKVAAIVALAPQIAFGTKPLRWGIASRRYLELWGSDGEKFTLWKVFLDGPLEVQRIYEERIKRHPEHPWQGNQFLDGARKALQKPPVNGELCPKCARMGVIKCSQTILHGKEQTEYFRVSRVCYYCHSRYTDALWMQCMSLDEFWQAMDL